MHHDCLRVRPMLLELHRLTACAEGHGQISQAAHQLSCVSVNQEQRTAYQKGVPVH